MNEASPPIGISTHPNATRLILIGDSITACSLKSRRVKKAQASFRRRLWYRLTTGPSFNETSETKKRRYSQCVSFFGASRALSNPPEPFPNRKSTCAKIAKALGLQMPSQYDAWWGRPASVVANYIVPKYARSIKPPLDVAVVLLGVNDFFGNATNAEVLSSLRSIVDTFHSVKTRVLLGTVLTQASSRLVNADDAGAVREVEEIQGKIVETNKLLHSYRGVFPPVNSGDEGLPFTLVDVTSGFDAKAMTFDGIHPNDLGEDHIGDAFFSALVPLIEQRSFECLGIAKTWGTPIRAQSRIPNSHERAGDLRTV